MIGNARCLHSIGLSVPEAASRVPGVPENIRVYDTDYRQVLRAAIRGGRLHAEMETRRSTALRRPHSDAYLELGIRLSQRISLEKRTGLSQLRLQEVHGKPLPLLKWPVPLSIPLRQPADRFLMRSFNQSSSEWAIRSRRILVRSRLREGDTRYRSERGEDGFRIQGESRPELWSLAGLAHELGHCLSEEARPVETLLDEIASEAFAQIHEQHVILGVLQSPDARTSWKQYQAAIDELNYAFFEWELAQIRNVASPVPEVGGMERLRWSGLLFRETLFTCPGYQLVYAAASWIRKSLEKPGDFEAVSASSTPNHS